ncbi:glycosyltransferase [bacterium]|nr:MAG: glycosyltransferase [bacterium]
MGNVLIVVPSLSGGGAERVMLHVARGLRDAGHTAVLVTLESGGGYEGQLPEGVERIDFKDGSNRRAIGRLAKLIRERKPDAVLSALDAANLVAILARMVSRRRPRLVVSIHNTLSQVYGPDSPAFKLRRLKIMRRTLRFADCIVGVSKGVCDDAAEVLGISRERFTAIHNPSVTPEMEALSREAVDEPWFAPGAPPTVVAMGRLTPQKDFPNLLNALAKIPGNVRLIVLGEGEERANLEALTAKLGLAERVKFPGFAQNPYGYLRHARLFVLSSAFEGFGVAVVEALACGTPVVSTDCPYGPSEILEGGRFGTLVPVGNSDCLAAAIQEELSHPKETPSEASWMPYRLSTIVDRYVEVLKLNA